jgi:hypothetical protein
VRCETKLGRIARLEVRTHLRQFYVDNYEHLHIAVSFFSLFNIKIRHMMMKAMYLIVLMALDLNGQLIKVLKLSKLFQQKKQLIKYQKYKKKWNLKSFIALIYF